MNLRRRVILGVGRQQERRLHEALREVLSLQLAKRSNSATELISRLEGTQADVLVLDDDLHVLNADRLQNLTRRPRVPMLLLVRDPASGWRGLSIGSGPQVVEIAAEMWKQ